MEFAHELKVPRERIAVLIGTGGETKTKIEESTKAELDIDSKEGDVIISGEDGFSLFQAREIVRAIARGFNPEFAFDLLKTDYTLEVIPLMEFARNKNDLERIRGRLIGREGKSRQMIEEYTETHVVIYGKTVSILGMSEHVGVARRAIQLLLSGSQHATVYKWLEKKRTELKSKEYGTHADSLL